MEESSTDGKAFDRNPGNTSEPGLKSQPVTDLEMYYDMSGEKHMIIFNHFQYKNTPFFRNQTPSPRKGTAADVKRLTSVFEGLGFKLSVHQDLDYERIVDVVTEVTTRDHSKSSCVAVVILTHGYSAGGLMAADRPYNLHDVLVPFHNAHPSLLGKPKLFILQACRGHNLDSGRVVHDGESHNLTLIPTHADFLILYSTIEDYVSWRDVRGSWLIQEFCGAVEDHASELDLLHIITAVNRRVALDRATYNPNPDLHNKKGMPEAQFTFTRLLRF